MLPSVSLILPPPLPSSPRAGAKALPLAVKVYAAALPALACLVLAAWLPRQPALPAGRWPLLLFFAAASAVAVLFPLSPSRSGKLTVATAPNFAALLLFGPALAMLVVGAGTLAAYLDLAVRGRRDRWNVMFNTGQKMLYVGAAGLALLLAGPPAAPFSLRTQRPATFLALAAAAVVAYALNGLAVTLVIALQHGRIPVWRVGLRRDILPEAALFAIGALAATDSERSPLTLVTLTVCAVVVHQALQRAVEAADEASVTVVRETDRLKGELLSVVSHELRTPLGTIKGYVSSLRHYGDRLDAAARAESLKAIDEATDRLAELVDNLLDLQRLEAGRLSVARDVVDLGEVAALVASAAPLSGAHRLELTIPPDLPPVLGDARRLRQVLQNLVDNAVKYSPDGGRVLVRAGNRGDAVEVRVEDEGVGIPADQLDRVFERFHRVDSSLTRQVAGTGLGLAIVRELMHAQGGGVRAESAGPGRGSTFILTLPAAAVSRAA